MVQARSVSYSLCKLSWEKQLFPAISFLFAKPVASSTQEAFSVSRNPGQFPWLPKSPATRTKLQGDKSGCVEHPVDIITTLPFWPGLAWPKRNFCYDVNGRFATT